MQIQTPASVVSQRIQSFKDNGYSHLDPSPYSDQLTLKEVKERTERVLLLLPKATREASEGNGWKTDDRYDPPTEQVAAQLDREVHRLQRRNQVIIGSVASVGIGLTGGILAGVSALPPWVGIASGVLGFGGLGCAMWNVMGLEGYSAKEVRQTAQDLRQWGALNGSP
ncbi:MAG: hypothetical protein U0931_28985 [Vulcanimicrobiota bacterium]